MHNIIFCAFLVVIGTVFAAFPQDIYDCLEQWKTAGDNGPSNKYMKLTRFFGLALIAAGIIVTIMLLI